MLMRFFRYTDPYSATDPASNAYFGNLSFVLHLANKTRIGCANFKPVGYPTGNSTTPSSTGGVVRPSATSTPPPSFTGAAVKLVGGTGAMLAAVAALIL
jgi:hypothetical protein